MYDSDELRALAKSIRAQTVWEASPGIVVKLLNCSDGLLALLDEIEALRKDKERLDSGVIIFRTYDSMGYDCVTESRGNDLRAMIDAAMELRDRDAARTQGGAA